MKTEAGQHGDPRHHSDDLSKLKAEIARLRGENTAETPNLEDQLSRIVQHLAVIERMIAEESKRAVGQFETLERSIDKKLRDLERRAARGTERWPGLT